MELLPAMIHTIPLFILLPIKDIINNLFELKKLGEEETWERSWENYFSKTYIMIHNYCYLVKPVLLSYAYIFYIIGLSPPSGKTKCSISKKFLTLSSNCGMKSSLVS